MAAPHRLRADAARNRENILRAARTLFAARGVAVGIDDVAREAGVAVGTLYRHFPTKSDLVNAILAELTDRLFTALGEAVARIEAGGSAVGELTVLTERVSAVAGEDRTIKSALSKLSVGARHPELHERAMAGLSRIVEAGHAEGSLHPDVTAADLVLTLGTLPGHELPEAARRRWVELILRGLTAGAVAVTTPSPAAGA